MPWGEYLNHQMFLKKMVIKRKLILEIRDNWIFCENIMGHYRFENIAQHETYTNQNTHREIVSNQPQVFVWMSDSSRYKDSEETDVAYRCKNEEIIRQKQKGVFILTVLTESIKFILFTMLYLNQLILLLCYIWY